MAEEKKISNKEEEQRRVKVELESLQDEKTEKVRKQKKSVRNIYDKERGLPIRVNLYIIKYIYYHIDKAKCFIEEKQEGKKAKSYEIYNNELPISRQRFNRINRGERFEISNSEAQDIIDRYGIDIKYFRRDNPIMFELDGLSSSDWKCFYSNKYKNTLNEVKGKNEKEITACAEKVQNALKRLVNENWENEMDKNNPLFYICFYFRYGRKWGTVDNVKQLREILKRMDYKEWDNVDNSLLAEDLKLLKKHTTYVNAILTINKFRNE